MVNWQKIPLNALRAFEAAARHQSFSRAAEELGVTHGAVSKQVRQLEDLIGRDLFKRTGRGVVLNERGSVLALEVQKGFKILGDSYQGFVKAKGGIRTLRITTVPSFAANFLIPRLDRFTQAHPNIRLSIGTTARLVDFGREPLDLGIRYGPGKWPGLVAKPLSSGVLVPVCSAGFLEKQKGKSAVEIIASNTLLHNLTAFEWRDWLAKAGLEAVKPAREYTLEDTNVIFQAALEGQGLALLPRILVQGALASNRLTRFDKTETEGAFRYWLVAREETFARADIQAFTTWVKNEAERAEKEA